MYGTNSLRVLACHILYGYFMALKQMYPRSGYASKSQEERQGCVEFPRRQLHDFFLIVIGFNDPQTPESRYINRIFASEIV
jgi:hypothetical protein